MYQKFTTTAELTADKQGNLNVRTKSGEEYQVTMQEMEQLLRIRGEKVTLKNNKDTATFWISKSGKALCFNDILTEFSFISLSSLLRICMKGGKGCFVAPPPPQPAPMKETVNVTPRKYGFEAQDRLDNAYPYRKVYPV